MLIGGWCSIVLSAFDLIKVEIQAYEAYRINRHDVLANL